MGRIVHSVEAERPTRRSRLSQLYGSAASLQRRADRANLGRGVKGRLRCVRSAWCPSYREMHPGPHTPSGPRGPQSKLCLGCRHMKITSDASRRPAPPVRLTRWWPPPTWSWPPRSRSAARCNKHPSRQGHSWLRLRRRSTHSAYRWRSCVDRCWKRSPGAIGDTARGRHSLTPRGLRRAPTSTWPRRLLLAASCAHSWLVPERNRTAGRAQGSTRPRRMA